MSASPRLQRLLLKMAKYDVEIRYIQGKTNVIADALSRVSHMEPPLKENEVPLLEVNAITSTLPASPAKLEEIRQCTDQDVVLAHLKDVVHHGWPEYPNECPQDLREFWNFREDLSVENGLILKRHCLVIPSRLHPQMLQIIHQGHMGTEKCLLKAKESLFWPSISRDIKELTANCATCIQFSKQQPKEALCPHSVPSFPIQFSWQFAPRCTISSSRRLLQQIPHPKEAELNDICCYYQSSQVNICRAWNTRIPGYRQWTPI